MTLKPEGDLDIMKMYFHAENEVARLIAGLYLTGRVEPPRENF